MKSGEGITLFLKKIKIMNFKCFKGVFELELNNGLNIIVGNNEAGKSTVLEAIHLALTGYFNGRSIRTELSQYLFNNTVVDEYIQAVKEGKKVIPPFLSIELFFDGTENPLFEGNKNSTKCKAEGLTLTIQYSEKFNSEYEQLISSRDISSLPIEYYDVVWESFARDSITGKSIPFRSAMIDSSNYKYQNGSDVYISRIVKDLLDEEDITKVSQAHRKMKEGFMKDISISSINDKLNQNLNPSLVNKKIQLTVELGTKNAWENSLVTQLDNVPFGFVGKGEQCIVKTELALSHKKVQEASVILLEEPESHLSHTKLNQLISAIEAKYADKQVIISTHNSFVANKLGLNNLILINEQHPIRFSELQSNEFFQKISGYDTLRLILCKKAILVEGDSDELVVQRAYMDIHNGKLPIENGIDVISVGTSFLRFLELAEKLKKAVVVVTDNDGDIEAIKNKYTNYLGDNKKDYIEICVDEIVDNGELVIGKQAYNYNTLEPKILKENSLEILNNIFYTSYTSEDDLRKYMKNNKTECALKIFTSEKTIKFPEYILEAVKSNE
jgi:putative ATP-dependent endonuclease of OLD family